MYCLTKFFLILCVIPLIKAVGLKIDGLLNLGDTWSYEYRILRTDSSDHPQLRAEEVAEDKALEAPQQKNEEVPRQIDVEAVFNKEKEKVLKREEENARVKEKASAGESHGETAHDKEKEFAGQNEEETARDNEKEIAVQKEEETARDNEKEIAGQKEEETARDNEKELARQRDEEIAHYKEKIARQNDEEAERIQRDDEHLSLAEHVLRKEANRLRKEAQSPKLDQRQGQDNGGQIHYIHNTNKPKTVGTTEAITSKKTEFATTQDSSNSDETDDSDNPNKGTLMINEATEPPKKQLREATNYSDSQYSSDSSDEESLSSSETSASFIGKQRQGTETPEADASTSSNESGVNIIKIDSYTTPKYAKELINKTLLDLVNKTIVQDENDAVGSLKTTKVTTVRSEKIFTDAHKVKDDANIIEFTNYLYKQTLKIFGNIKEKTNQDNVKKKIDSLMKSYKEQFLQYLSKTRGQTIRTRLGTQKVILNTIDTSNRLLRRLMNIMVSDLDKKGILRHNAGIANRFQKAIDLEEKLLSFYACRKYGICRNGSRFSSFLADIMAILLKCDDNKFKQSVDAFTEAIKYKHFNYILEPETEIKLKVVVDMIERESIIKLRAMIMVLKSTILCQNKPMIVSHYIKRRSIVNSTLALLEVIDLLDTKIPKNRTNVLEWADMKLSLEDFADDKRTDVQDTMTTIVRHVTNHLRGLDVKSKKIISKNMDIILSLGVDTFS